MAVQAVAQRFDVAEVFAYAVTDFDVAEFNLHLSLRSALNPQKRIFFRQKIQFFLFDRLRRFGLFLFSEKNFFFFG